MRKTTFLAAVCLLLFASSDCEAHYPFVRQTRIAQPAPGGEYFWVDLCVDAADQIHLIWSESTPQAPRHYRLYYRKYNNLAEPTSPMVELTPPGWGIWIQPSIYSNGGTKIAIVGVIGDTLTDAMAWNVWYSDGSGVFEDPVHFATDQPYHWAKGYASMAMNLSGRSVIPWENASIDNGATAYYEVRNEQNQKIDSTRECRSGEYVYFAASVTRAAMAPSGQFVIAWEADHGPDEVWYEKGFYPLQPTARIFDALGNPISNEIYVACEGFPETCSGDTATHYTGKASGKFPDVAMEDDGDFAVLYRRTFAYDCAKEYYCLRRFNADGTPKGPNIQVSDLTECFAFSKASRIMSDSVGNLLAIWTNNNVNGHWSHWNNLYAQRFDSLGNKIGVNFRLNDIPMTGSTGIWELFGADMNENGLVAVVCDEHGLLGPGAGITLMTMDVQDIGYFISGDANRDYMINISDAVFLISYIFAGGIAPVEPCLGDPDGNGMINISDAVSLINYIFLGGQVVGECP